MTQPLLQLASTHRSAVGLTFEATLAPRRWICVHIAAAYATVSGVRYLLDRLPAATRTEWLIGLDDALTHPDAIELVLGLEGAVVRIAKAASGFRFHPKVYYFESSTPRYPDVILIGSANLTRAAFTVNTEAVALLSAATPARRVTFGRIWDELWAQGTLASEAELRDYRARYARARPLRDRLANVTRVAGPTLRSDVLERDTADADPTRAESCWIECGYVTAMGRELELKSELGLFFGLDPHGGPPRLLTFHVSDGTQTQLRWKYQENHMWRLQLSNDVPEVRRGLRPRLGDGTLGRSPFIALFKRRAVPGNFDLQFVRLGTARARFIERESSKHGTVGRTSARSYGWF